MQEERMQILRMIQEGMITAEEGAKLIAALGEPRREGAAPSQPQGREVALQRRWLRIRVTDKNNERARVNVTIPIALLDWGLRMAEMSGVDLAAIRQAIHGGAEGRIIEIDESESGERVEIFVE